MDNGHESLATTVRRHGRLGRCSTRPFPFTALFFIGNILFPALEGGRVPILYRVLSCLLFFPLDDSITSVVRIFFVSTSCA